MVRVAFMDSPWHLRIRTSMNISTCFTVVAGFSNMSICSRICESLLAGSKQALQWRTCEIESGIVSGCCVGFCWSCRCLSLVFEIKGCLGNLDEKEGCGVKKKSWTFHESRTSWHQGVSKSAKPTFWHTDAKLIRVVRTFCKSQFFNGHQKWTGKTP